MSWGYFHPQLVLSLITRGCCYFLRPSCLLGFLDLESQVLSDRSYVNEKKSSVKSAGNYKYVKWLMGNQGLFSRVANLIRIHDLRSECRSKQIRNTIDVY